MGSRNYLIISTQIVGSLGRQSRVIYSSDNFNFKPLVPSDYLPRFSTPPMPVCNLLSNRNPGHYWNESSDAPSADAWRLQAHQDDWRRRIWQSVLFFHSRPFFPNSTVNWPSIRTLSRKSLSSKSNERISSKNRRGANWCVKSSCCRCVFVSFGLAPTHVSHLCL